MATDPERSSGSRGRHILTALYGIPDAAAAWWLIDILTFEQSQRLSRAAPAVWVMLGLVVVTIVATLLLLLSRFALLAAAGTIVLGIVLGGYGSGSPLITSWSQDAQFVLLRGAHEPAIWTLGAIWLTIAVTNTITQRVRTR